MRNPIFSADTRFLDRTTGEKISYVTAGADSAPAGIRLISLETPQSLVRLETHSGSSITLSPESVFALSQKDGSLIRYTPVDDRFAPIKPDWQDIHDPLLRYIVAGLVCANGVHSLERGRPSNMIVPADMADDIVRFLFLFGQHLFETKRTARPPRITAKPAPGGIFIKSSAVTTLIGSLLQDKTQRLNVALDACPSLLRWGFLRGLLSSSTPLKNGGLEFRHRVADTVRAIHDALWVGFGVPSSLLINSMEAEVTQTTNGIMPHRLRLSAEQRMRARAAGLEPLKETDKEPSLTHYDQIAKITPIVERQKAVIVVPMEGGGSLQSPLTADSFIFEPAFSLPSAVVDIASHPMMVADTSDPALL